MKRNPLHALCPYFAMFPETFVRTQVDRYTAKNDLVLDPFSGRGTTVLQSLLMGRQAAAVDVNPVAYCVSAAKADPPSVADILGRVDDLEHTFDATDVAALDAQYAELGEFFEHCFHPSVARRLLFLRQELQWETNPIDRFVAALVLGSLHGEADKSSSYFSNQMPRTISTKPAYSVRYWRERGLTPPERDVWRILRQRAGMRLSGDLPTLRGSVGFGDVRQVHELLDVRRAKLVVTSPPYFNVTNFEEDQWLRLWFLGNAAAPTTNQISQDDRYLRADSYWAFLQEAWTAIAPICDQSFTFVCRIGATKLSADELSDGLLNTLESVFSKITFKQPPIISPLGKKQSSNFLPGVPGCSFELDVAYAIKQ